jgi:hypothetical protein
MSSDVKESEIEVYDSQDDTRPEYGSLWDDDHLNMLLDHGPEGAFDEMLAKYAASGEVLVL